MSNPETNFHKFSPKRNFYSGTATVNVGSSSLLMIFVVLCLVSFAALSIVSAVADQRLSVKVSDHSTAYYDACNLAEQRISQIDTVLYSYYLESDSEEAYFDKAGHSISFAIPVTEIHTLNVGLEILYPDSPEGSFYRLTAYNLTPTGTLEPDESLPVFE